MASEESTRQKLLSVLADRPRHIINGVISINKPAIASRIHRRSPSNHDLGTLDTLPLELLHFIFSMLDLKTLSNLGRTCLRGTEILQSLPEYRDLIRYAPHALSALGCTGLLSVHSASKLYRTLRSPSCTSCSGYGAFVFLPSFERCCYDCQWRNQSLWVTSVSQAQSCFQLSKASIQTLPVLRSLPGKYHLRHLHSRKRRLRLISVRAAKELAINNGRSPELMAQELEHRRAAGLSIEEYYTQRWLQTAPLQPPGPMLALPPTQANKPNDKFCGMASIALSWLSPSGRVDHGFWCLGCEKLCREWSPNKPGHPFYQMAGSGKDVNDMLCVMQHKERSEEEFFQHIQYCMGAKELLPSLEDDLLQVSQP